ncbi:hypothetical protein P0Y35_11750 [Kiritimatiellaeota bacterium B1221]|nr:hypothetical protein [Kiritimatiellaeota bacterium B1221]
MTKRAERVADAILAEQRAENSKTFKRGYPFLKILLVIHLVMFLNIPLGFVFIAITGDVIFNLYRDRLNNEFRIIGNYPIIR